MAKNENTTDEGQETLTKEELKERRAEITAYYKDNIKDLKIQLEYEELLRDIEKTRAERLQAQMFMSQSMAVPPEEKSDVEAMKQAQEDWTREQAAAPPKRVLKRQES